MALSYPGEKSTLAEHIARDAFLVALSDTEFELKIRILSSNQFSK